MAEQQKEVRDLQEGAYVMIDDAPVKINAYSTAQPGKHGSAKARVEGRGVFDDKKRNFSQSVDQKIQVPIINRKQGQVISVQDDEAQIMDQETYDTFTMRIPESEELTPDDEIEFLEWEGKRKIVRN
jgi:translation initiation factor 5A